MNSTVAVLDQVVADLDEMLSAEAMSALSDADRVRVLCAAGEAFRRVEAVIVEAVASSEPEFPEQAGCRSMNELLQRTLRIDSHGAARITKAATAVARHLAVTTGERLPARWPALRDALLDGVTGITGLLAGIGPIEQAAPRLTLADIWDADAALAAYARGHHLPGEVDIDAGADLDADADAPSPTADDVRQYAQVLAMVLDPDGAEPSDRNAQQDRFITIGRLRNGLHSLHGNLLPDTAAQLQLIIDAQCNPKTDGPPTPGVVFRPSEAAGEEAGQDLAEDPFNSDPRSVIDPRTAAQKRHDALAAALGIAARHPEMPTLAGAAPTLVVHVDAKDYASGSGWASIAGSGAPVPLHVAAHTACTGTIQRVLFDEGRIVGISVTDRVFTIHQRRAIVARDRECLIPGCHVPASWCEIHHVTEHARGGPTHTDNGVPLCWWHHRSLDHSGSEIRMSEGLPQIRGPAWWDPDQRWRTPHPPIPTPLRR